MTTLSAASQVVLNNFGTQLDVNSDHVEALRNILNASPALTVQFNKAVAEGRLTKVMPLTNPHAGGEYSYPEMRLPLAKLNPEGAANMTFVLGHELQHGFNHAATQIAYAQFETAVKVVAVGKHAPRDYTAPIAALISANRRDEASAEIAGWNAIVSSLSSHEHTPTLQEIFNSSQYRMRDFIDVTEGTPKIYTLKPNLHFNVDMTMLADALNIEGMGKNYFEKSSEKAKLGFHGNSDYANFYGAYAIGVIERAERAKHPIHAGTSSAPIALNMASLRLDEKLLEENGINLGQPGHPLRYVNGGKPPPNAGLFQHTFSTHAHVMPISAQAYEDACAQQRSLHNPGHPDHALFRNIAGRVQALDASHGRAFDAASERISASLVLLAKERGLAGVDVLTLSTDGRKIFMIQGAASDPVGRQIAGMPVVEANARSMTETSRQIESFNEQCALQSRQQEIQQSMQSPPVPHTQQTPVMHR